jgi:dihydrodipicolinate synthase/N-acetylneuraminate lyase
MKPANPYRGVVVPMVSPFTPDGRVDTDAAARVANHLVAHGVAGVFPLGTTGEAASIPIPEKRRLVAAVVEAPARRAMVYAGIPSNCFRESVEAAEAYKASGVDAVVAHLPSYYPLSDAEIEAYLLRLADAVPLPLVLYNIPATTHHSLSFDVIDALRRHPNVVALKDSSGDRQRIEQVLDHVGADFPVLLGSSSLYSVGLRRGAVGVIPSGAHLVPELYQAMVEAAGRKDWDAVDQLQVQTDAACAAYLKGRSLGQSLAVLKSLLQAKGLCGRTMLPPLQDYAGN